MFDKLNKVDIFYVGERVSMVFVFLIVRDKWKKRRIFESFVEM